MSVIASQLIGKVGLEGSEQTLRGLKDIGTATDETSHRFSGLKSMFSDALSFAAGQAIFSGFGMLKDQLVGIVKAGMDQQAVMAQTVQVLKSTHDVSGMTAQSVNDLADSLSHVTMFGDDTVQSGENLLLTFTNIGKDVFPQATKSMLDISQAMGQDVKSSAVQLGMALNDPLTGMTRLQRIGVTFSEQQKELIKTYMAHNELAKAQGVILKELQREFGGSAEAAGKTFGGQLAILQNRVDQLKEKIGLALLPALTSLVSFLADTALPILDRFTDWVILTAIPQTDRYVSLIDKQVLGIFRALVQQFQQFTLPYFELLRKTVEDNRHYFDLLATIIQDEAMKAISLVTETIRMDSVPAFALFSQAIGTTTQAMHSATPIYTAFAQLTRDVLGGSFRKAGQDSLVMIEQIRLSAAQLPTLLKSINISDSLKISAPSGVGIGAPILGGLQGILGPVQQAMQNIIGAIETALAPIASWINTNVIQPIIAEWQQVTTDLQPFFDQFGQFWQAKIIPLLKQLGLDFEDMGKKVGGSEKGSTKSMFKELLDIGGQLFEMIVKGGIVIVEIVLPAFLTLADAALKLFNTFQHNQPHLQNFLDTVLKILQNVNPTIGEFDAFMQMVGRVGDAFDYAGRMVQVFFNHLGGLGNLPVIGGILQLLHLAPSGGFSQWGAPVDNQNNLGGGGVRGHASGILDNPIGHWAMVGERGPEAMYVPRGASILPSGTMPSGGQGGGNQPIILSIDGVQFARVIAPYTTNHIRNNVGSVGW